MGKPEMAFKASGKATASPGEKTKNKWATSAFLTKIQYSYRESHHRSSYVLRFCRVGSSWYVRQEAAITTKLPCSQINVLKADTEHGLSLSIGSDCFWKIQLGEILRSQNISSSDSINSTVAWTLQERLDKKLFLNCTLAGRNNHWRCSTIADPAIHLPSN